MSSFQSALLVDKLNKLNSTQQSIETLSCYCIFHLKSSKDIVKLWNKQFASVSLSRKMSLLYLANDILQKARKKAESHYANEFYKILPGVLRHVRKHCDEEGAGKLERLVGLWGERGVYSASAIETFRKALADGAAQNTANMDGQSTGPQSDAQHAQAVASPSSSRGPLSSLKDLSQDIALLEDAVKGTQLQYDLAKSSIEFNTSLTSAQKAAFRPSVSAHKEALNNLLDTRQAFFLQLQNVVKELEGSIAQSAAELDAVNKIEALLPEDNTSLQPSSEPNHASSAPVAGDLQTVSGEASTSAMPALAESSGEAGGSIPAQPAAVAASLEAAASTVNAAQFLASILRAVPAAQATAPDGAVAGEDAMGSAEPLPKKTKLQETPDLDLS